MVSGPNDELRLPCFSHLWITGSHAKTAVILTPSYCQLLRERTNQTACPGPLRWQRPPPDLTALASHLYCNWLVNLSAKTMFVMKENEYDGW